MKSFLAFTLALLAVAFVAGAGCDSPRSVSGDYALVDVTVIDTRGDPPARGMTLVVRGERIVALGRTPELRIEPGTPTIDMRGKYVIPGLVDMHVHDQDTPWVSPPLYVATGVTTVREMSGAPYLLDWRERIEAGELLGPRMIVGSPVVDGTPSLWQNTPVPHFAVEGVADAREAVRQVAGEGYDFVKVYSRLSPESFTAIADEARTSGIPFAGHCPDFVPLSEASARGQATFEHLFGIMWATSSHEAELRPRIDAIALEPDSITGFNTWFQQTNAIEWDAVHTHSEAKAAELFAQLIHDGAAQVPTLVFHDVLDNTMEIDPDDPRLQYLPPGMVAQWTWQLAQIYLAGRSPTEWSQRAELFKHRLALVAAMHRAGVTVLAGTDSTTPWVFPGFGLHDELELLVRAGLSPAEAIAAATREPARVLGLEDSLGTVDEGKIADLVVLDENPLEDIRRTRAIHAVVVRGRLITSDERARLLEEVAAAAAAMPPTP